MGQAGPVLSRQGRIHRPPSRACHGDGGAANPQSRGGGGESCSDSFGVFGVWHLIIDIWCLIIYVRCLVWDIIWLLIPVSHFFVDVVLAFCYFDIFTPRARHGGDGAANPNP